MFQAWLLNALNFFFPLLATLLILISQQTLQRSTASLKPEELNVALRRHHKRLSIAIGLLAAWLVVQYLPFIYP